MTKEDEVAVIDVPVENRAELRWILEDSFEGWYLRHSMGTLESVETVRAAVSAGSPLGLVMLKMLGPTSGYVFYIAVARAHRREGVARVLLDDALGRFKSAGAKEVFASVEEDNEPSERLFASAGFSKTSFGEVSKAHGRLRAVNMYRMMRVVPGEALLRKLLAQAGA